MLILIKYKWDLDKFGQLPRHYWQEIANQRAFMNDFAQKHNIQTEEDWYHVTYHKLFQHGGAGILQQYNNSPSKLITTLFPQYLESLVLWLHRRFHWDLTKFSHVPKGFWNSLVNQRKFMEDIARKFSISCVLKIDHHDITTPEDWHLISEKELREHGGGALLSKYNNSIRKAVFFIAPHSTKVNFGISLAQVKKIRCME